jgi:hypothetical protein
MDSTEALNLFVKNHIKLLLLEIFPKENFRKEKLSFFMDSRKDLRHVPRDEEIANFTLRYMIRNGIIRDKERLSRILELPFFKENIHRVEPFDELLSLQSESIKVIDPHILSDAEKIDRIKAEITKEVIRENSQQIDEAIEKKKQQYRSLPSILEQEDFEEPEVVRIEQEEDFTLWWKQLRLSDDPFPTQDGIFVLPEELYEKIVYKTPIFNRYLSYIKQSSGELFKDAIFFGQFGSGKTTLFDYLKKPLMNQRIFLVIIQLYSEETFQGLMAKFRKKLFLGLCDLHELIYDTNPSHSMKGVDLQEDIEVLLKKFRSDKDKVRGLIVVIDNLHKRREEFDIAMRFITNLQTFKSDILRKLPNLGIGFYVAGSTDWETIIKNDPQFSGSYMKHETMPPVTEEAAYEMLNRRLTTFAINEETIKQINIDFVKKIYRSLQNNNEPITFRSFIKATLAEFEKGNFDILTADPIHVSDQTLSEIRELFLANDTLKSRFETLFNGIQQPENKRKTLESLIEIYLRKGISEFEDSLRGNLFNFQRLSKTGLIQKTRLDSQLKWTVCKELTDTNKHIFETYNLSLEDYLIKLFISNVNAKSNSEKGPSEDFILLDSLLNHLYNKEALALVRASRDVHEKAADLMETIERDTQSTEIVDDCVLSLSLLTKALARFLGIQVEIIDNRAFLSDFWRDFWFYPSEISEFLNQAAMLKDIKKGVRVWYSCVIYRDAYFSLLNFFQQEIDKSRYIMIPVSGLTKSETEEFHDLRNQLLNHEFFETVDGLSHLMEQKLRIYLYNIFRILYGDQQSRVKHLDKGTREYILGNIEKDRTRDLGISRNEFEQLNRGNFKNFMIGAYNKDIGLDNWRNIFQFVFSPMSENDVRDFLDTMADFNIATSHAKKSAFGGEQQARIFNYMSKSIEIIRKMNESYSSLVRKGLYTIEQPFGSTPRIVFSFCNLADGKSLCPINVKPSNAARIGEHFIRQQNISVDLEDSFFIESNYGVDYREFIAILNRIINQNQAEQRKTGLFATILSIKGSIINLKVERVKLV